MVKKLDVNNFGQKYSHFLGCVSNIVFVIYHRFLSADEGAYCEIFFIR